MQEWGGDLSNPTNYRPISILPILSKVFEKHVHGNISDHLLLHSPILDQQWGFTTRKSTTAAVLSMTHDCTQALDRGKEVSTVCFDISKAFDSVPHLPLLRRLAVINIDPYIRKWVHNYLSGREQYVVVNGTNPQFCQLSLEFLRVPYLAHCCFLFASMR